MVGFSDQWVVTEQSKFQIVARHDFPTKSAVKNVEIFARWIESRFSLSRVVNVFLDPKHGYYTITVATCDEKDKQDLDAMDGDFDTLCPDNGYGYCLATEYFPISKTSRDSDNFFLMEFLLSSFYKKQIAR
jgi:hypothetical protein